MNGAYVMGYFRSGPAQCHKTEQLHYAFSRDGRYWYELNRNAPVFRTRLGEGILRDPFIAKGGDGYWHMVYTIRPRGTTIGYARSKDLISWTDERLLEVMSGTEGVQNCWAPEFTYDDEQGNYLLYWASSIGGDLGNSKHYCTRTADWETFETAELFFDPGFQTIDASLIQHDGMYYMGVKDESHVYEAARFPDPPCNKLAVSERPEGRYRLLLGFRTPDYTEAPEFFRTYDGRILLIYDYWAYGKFGMMETADMKAWRELNEEEFRVPFQARHATVFPVSETELQALLERYAVEAFYPTTTYDRVRLAEEAAGGFMHEPFAIKSICMRICPRSLEGTGVLYQEGDDRNGWALRLRDGRLEAAVCSGGRSTVHSEADGSSGQCRALSETDDRNAVLPSEWHHVAMVFREGEITLYIDGKLVGRALAPFRLVGANCAEGGFGGRFGTDAFGEKEGEAAFQGAIKQLKVYSVPLTEADLQGVVHSKR